MHLWPRPRESWPRPWPRPLVALLTSLLLAQIDVHASSGTWLLGDRSSGLRVPVSVCNTGMLYPVYTMQPAVQPVGQAVASCKQTFNRRSKMDRVVSLV